MPKDIRYRVEGITPLRGDVTLSGSKNAALPCMCAALLTKEEVVLRNVPDIADVHSLLAIFTHLGVEHSFEDHTLKIRAAKLEPKKIPHELVGNFRASILLLGPLLARFGEVTMAYPGGCVIGKRPVVAHLDALIQMGAEDHSTDETLHLRGTLKGGEVVLPEFSVTATENALLAAAVGKESVTMHIAAAEPHVQDLCRCLETFGAKIEGKGTHDITVHGASLHGGEHIVTTDYLEAGFFVLAGILTGGDLTIHGVQKDQLRSFFKALERMGAVWDWKGEGELHVQGGAPMKGCRIQTNVFPGFPTDLQPAFGVAMTQAQGVSRIQELFYESRFGYIFELEKMGANVEMLNPHEALLIGPTPLRGATVASNDIRAGAAMVLAALCARGESLITDVRYIERGYERLEEKLRSIGASIHREEIQAIEKEGAVQVDLQHTSSTLSTNGADPEQRRPLAPLREQSGIPLRVSGE